jgi:hypothetical protein
MTNSVDQNAQAMLAKMARKVAERPLAKWQTHADVDWDDLEHFIGNCKRRGDRESFDTALNVLQALKQQVLERK